MPEPDEGKSIYGITIVSAPLEGLQRNYYQAQDFIEFSADMALNALSDGRKVLGGEWMGKPMNIEEMDEVADFLESMIASEEQRWEP